MVCDQCGKPVVMGIDPLVEVRIGLVPGVAQEMVLLPEQMDVSMRVCTRCVKPAAPKVAGFVSRFSDVLSSARVRFERQVQAVEGDGDDE